jgi:DNA ligase-1
MTNGICQRSSKEAWKDVNFMAFDVTNVQMLYEERIKLLAERLPNGVLSPSAVQAREKGMHVCVLPMVQCRDNEHCREELHRVEEQGGEGLMLRKPKSKYECRGPGRSKVIWKVK